MSTTMEFLMARYGVTVGVIEAGRALQLAEQTTRNKIKDGTFPLPSFVPPGARKRVVMTEDLARFLDTLAQQSKGDGARLRRGRPNKLEQQEAARLGITVAQLRARVAGGVQ